MWIVLRATVQEGLPKSYMERPGSLGVLNSSGLNCTRDEAELRRAHQTVPSGELAMPGPVTKPSSCEVNK